MVERQYSDIFETLVDVGVEGDVLALESLEGLIAYGVYKHEKRKFIVSHRRRNNGSDPSVQDCRAWVENYRQIRLPSLQREASQYLKDFQEAATLENRRWMEETIRKFHEETREPWRRGFWQSFWASVLFSVIIAFFSILALFQADLADVFQALAEALR